MKDVNINLDNIAMHKNGKYRDWKSSIEKEISIVYDSQEYKFVIKGYDIKKSKLTLSHNNKIYYITASNLLKNRVGVMINKYFKEHKYHVNDILKDNNRDIKITRLIKDGAERRYQYTCNKCGCENGTMLEGNLISGKGCGCCAGRVVVPEINSISFKEQWMVDLGVDEEEAKKFTANSNKKIKCKCPCCKKEFEKKCNFIFSKKSIGCTCGYGVSYPEKFVSCMLKQMKLKFITQLSKADYEWCGKYRYDFFIEPLKMIIETHGIQHYEETPRGRSLDAEKENDINKKNLASPNVDSYVVIDCRHSNLNYIKEHIKESLENTGLEKELDNVNWEECEKYAIMTNLVKEASDLWEKKEENETVSDIANKMNKSKSAVTTWLKKGAKLGFCTYNPKNEATKSKSRSAIKRNSKPIEIFNEQKNIREKFNSAKELEEQSPEKFGLLLKRDNILKVANKKKDSYEGFTVNFIEREIQI